MLAPAAALLVLASFGSAARAQEARSVDLTVKKTVSPKRVQVGERQVFTVRITNERSARAEGARMRNPLPSAVRFVRATTSREVPGSCGIEDRIVRCRLGKLRPDRTVKIYVKPVVAGSYTNRAFASHKNAAGLQLQDADGVRTGVEPRG